MSQSNIQHITLSAGEKRELVFINESHVDWHITQHEGSSLLLHVIALPNPADTTNQQQATITVEHKANGCRTEIYGLGLLHKNQRCDMVTRVLHQVGGGYSSQLIKFVLDDESKATFRGKLKIIPDAQQVEAYQTNRNILLSRQADMLTEPQLEIYADDVKASHGATTGQLDDAALFYMQQRCISREVAAKLLLQAFFEEVVSTLSDENVREEITQKIQDIL